MDKLTPDALTTFLWVAAALAAATLSIWGLLDRIKKRIEWRQSVDRKLDRDNKRIEAHDEGMKIFCKGMLAMVSHEINGNSIDKLKDVKEEMTEYLLNK